MEKIKTAIGLMSGTSLDGIDAALLVSNGQDYIDVIDTMHIAYPESFRQRLQQGLIEAQTIKYPNERPGQLAELETDLTLYHAKIVEMLLEKTNRSTADIDLLGFHGQTVLHRPPLEKHFQKPNYKPFTVQLGDGALLATRTGITTIADMRSNDMKFGGNGAPLVPVYHRALAHKISGKCELPIMFVNIGGISNGTYVGNLSDNAKAELIAYDFGPGNALLDQWSQIMTGNYFDEGGKAALQGEVLPWLKEAYFALSIFKEKRRSFDRLDFIPLDQLLQKYPKIKASYQDGAATLAYITAKAIMNACDDFKCPPKTMIISGGGVRNAAIMLFLQQLGKDKDIKIISADALRLDSEFMEAESWGYLAIRSFYGLALTFPTTTGVNMPVSGGKLYTP